MNEPDAVEQSDRDQDQPEFRYTAWTFVKHVLLQLLIFFVLYTLSIGPMFWTYFGGRNRVPVSPVAVFYEPLFRLAGWCEPFGEFLNWYVDLWIG